MIYILHIDPPLKHAHHYVGWTKDCIVDRRVREHLEQRGSRPSKLVRAALAAGCVVTLAATLEGDRTFERRLKNRGGASRYCPACRALKKSPGDSHSPREPLREEPGRRGSDASLVQQTANRLDLLQQVPREAPRRGESP